MELRFEELYPVGHLVEEVVLFPVPHLESPVFASLMMKMRCLALGMVEVRLWVPLVHLAAQQRGLCFCAIALVDPFQMVLMLQHCDLVVG